MATITTVHPHGRGDNVVEPLYLDDPHGSPPRAWGQSVPYADPQVVRRFTPTGVGTITHQPALLLPRAVHPHGRGDNASRNRIVKHPHGSPPRAWGQLED